MTSTERVVCPLLRPSKEDFAKPFPEYVEKVFKKHPDWPCFRVVPPKGFTPRKGGLPPTRSVLINTPIRQHVVGSSGVFKCVHIEQKAISLADFKDYANLPDNQAPPKGHRKDDLLERAFWSRVSLNPPLYGADTDVSFFDKDLEFGWNLHDLGDLLHQYNVPKIPGVTTPMTYFGMWKSFFSWHVEDVDLYSVNYLHFGAPKVWYCVPPKERAKFEHMARSIMMGDHKKCKGFLRHKEVLISPTVLRQYHVDYVLAKQEAGQFMVLNAGAYHCGYNQGYNCAEAVNFAVKDWIPQGKAAVRCECRALPDGVRIDMSTFKQGKRGSKRKRGGTSPKRKQGVGRPPNRSTGNSTSDEESDDEEDQDDEEDDGDSNETRSSISSSDEVDMDSEDESCGSRRSPRQAQDDHGGMRTRSRQPSRQKRNGGRPASAKTLRSPSLPARNQKRAAPRGSSKGSPAKKLRVGSAPAGRAAGKPTLPKRPASAKGRGASLEPRAPHSRVMPSGPYALDSDEFKTKGSSWRAIQMGYSMWKPKGVAQSSQLRTDYQLLDDKVHAIVGEFDNEYNKYFHLVQRLTIPARKAGRVTLRLLQECQDGLFRPTDEVWEEASSSLVDVRTQLVEGKGDERGFRLLTLRRRILDTELIE